MSRNITISKITTLKNVPVLSPRGAKIKSFTLICSARMCDVISDELEHYLGYGVAPSMIAHVDLSFLRNLHRSITIAIDDNDILGPRTYEMLKPLLDEINLMDRAKCSPDYEIDIG